ncbi:MAG: chromosome segregation ATPase [Synechocystis sp.]|nr:chromosome segregation ATPase [Synechocystis sp.]
MNSTSSLSVLRAFRNTVQRFPLQFWAALLIVVSGGIGFVSTNWLLSLPQSPQCSRIFWPVASASMRLYCAQLAAEEKTVDSLLKAIELLAGLPKSHPLAAEVNRNIEEWATELLDLSETFFQDGKLEEAIASAQRIPAHVQAYDLVEERIAAWQTLWDKGETIYEEVETDLRKARWNSAFRNAVRLLNLDNRYWSTTKYDAAIRNIQLAQAESSKLDTAYKILNRGGIDNWLKAIEDAAKIPKESYAYEEAQVLIGKAVAKLTDTINTLIDDRDWQTLANLMDRLPVSRFPADEINDWQVLATAGSEAQTGTLNGLELAITTVERIADPSRPYYDLAQELIIGWRTEETAMQQLATARDTAAAGTISALNQAIAQAQLVSRDNPRYGDATRDIANWTKQVQISEDRPVLNRARDLATSRNISDLEQAIRQASQISADRALYAEARQNIREWQAIVQTQEDQPILDQAIALGNAQNYAAAISTAQQIAKGRALFSEARSNINRWQTEINAQRNLKQAQALAANRTVDSLTQAIRVIKQVPRFTDAGSQRDQAINNWSYQILSLAQEQASIANYSQAIRLARQVPADSTAYDTAQDLTREWRNRIQPAVPQAPVYNSAPPAPPAPAVEVTPMPSEPELPPLRTIPANDNNL